MKISLYTSIAISFTCVSLQAMDPEMQVIMYHNHNIMMQQHHLTMKTLAAHSLATPPLHQFVKPPTSLRPTLPASSLGAAPAQQTMETTDHSTMKIRVKNLCCNKYVKKNKCCGICINSCTCIICCPCTTCVSCSYICCNDSCTQSCVSACLDQR